MKDVTWGKFMTKNHLFNNFPQLDTDKNYEPSGGRAECTIDAPQALLAQHRFTTMSTEKVMEAEATNRLLLNAFPDVLIRMDQDGTYLDLIRTDGVEILKDREQFIGRNIGEILPREIAQERMQYVKQALQTGETQVYEYKLETNGKIRYEEARIVARGDAEVIAIIRDITTRKQVEEQLRRSEANLRLAQRVAQVGSWELDVETQKMSWSEEMWRIVGRAASETELTLADYVQYIHPDDQPRWQEVMGQALIEGLPYELDFRILRSDDSVRHVAAKCEAVTDAEGRVSHLFGTILDITERKRAEELLRSQAQRERLNSTNYRKRN
jgi:PAS domain S-box-containing protein